jgi:hypothetical protein
LHEVRVTQNLHAALLKLRNPYFERIVWIDALCINQNVKKEKAHQVWAMARIYGLARRVVVWLGDEDDDSALAFQELSELASKVQGAISESNTNGVTRTLDLAYDASKSVANEGPPTLKASEHSAFIRDDYHVDDDARNQRRYGKTMRRKREKAIFALLERRYFRRIWVSSCFRSLLPRCCWIKCR